MCCFDQNLSCCVTYENLSVEVVKSYIDSLSSSSKRL